VSAALPALESVLTGLRREARDVSRGRIYSTRDPILDQRKPVVDPDESFATLK
jgi:hypothetical protein